MVAFMSLQIKESRGKCKFNPEHGILLFGSHIKLTTYPDSKQLYYCEICRWIFNEKGEGNTI